MLINLRYTPLGLAFAEKLGKAAVNERIRGELAEMLSDAGGLQSLQHLVFHTVWMNAVYEDAFVIVPDKNDPEGVLVDTEAVCFEGDDAALSEGPFKGYTVHIPQGASLGDSWQEDDAE